MAQGVEFLPWKCEVLSSVSSTIKKNTYVLIGLEYKTHWSPVYETSDSQSLIDWKWNNIKGNTKQMKAKKN
jgi:hypothetical protein